MDKNAKKHSHRNVSCTEIDGLEDFRVLLDPTRIQQVTWCIVLPMAEIHCTGKVREEEGS